MKRKILMLLCLCMAVVFALSACVGPVPGGDEQTTTGKPTEDNPQNTCEHTFSNAWSSDATQHWHAATCEHGEVKDSLANHADADEDGKCDVCAYELGHTHTYAKEWSTDDSYHWHAATCTHTDEKKDYVLHADIDENGKCDVCEAHVHTVDETGYCTGCGEQIEEIEINELEQLLAAVIASSKNALSGKVVYDVIIRGLTEEIQESYELDYLFATDGIYTKRSELVAAETGSTLLTESWIKMGGDEEMTAVQTVKLLEEVIDAQPISVSEDHLLGDYFAVSTLANAYGAEGILYALYEVSQLESASEYTFAISEENKTALFSFNALIINEDTAEGEDDGVDYYEVEVAFSFSEKYTLTSLAIKCDCYTNSLANEEENDYTYDQENKTITMKDTAKADTYTYQVVQTEGERVALDMAAVEPFIPTDVTVYVDEELTEKAESFNITVGDNSVELFFGCAPDGSFIRFAQGLDITVTNTADGSAAAGLGAYLVGEVIQILPYAAGEYTITVTYGENVQTIAVVVEGVELSGDGSFEVEITDTYAWVDVYEFTATESGAYTFYLPANFGAWDAEGCDDFSMNPWVDYQGMSYDATAEHSFTVDIAAGETYRFYCSAMAKGTYTVGYSFEAKDVAPEGGDDEGGDDETDDGALKIGDTSVKFTEEEIAAGTATRTFTATVDGAYALNGNNQLFVVSVTDSNGNAIAKENYLYFTLTAGETYTVEFGMFSMLGIQANKAYTFTVVAPATGDEGGDEEEITVVPGTYIGTDLWNNAPLTVIVTETTVTFIHEHPMSGISEIVATYEVVDGAIVLYDEEGVVLNPLAGSLTIDENGTPVAAEYNGTSYVLAPSDGEGDDEGDEPGDEPVGDLWQDEENAIEVTQDDIDAGMILYGFYSGDAGDYKFSSSALMVAIKDAEGNEIVRNADYTYTLDSWTQYYVEIKTNYVFAPGEYKLTVEYIYPLGHQENPIEIETGDHIAIGGNYSIVWHAFYAPADGTVTISTGYETATLLMSLIPGNETEGYGELTMKVLAGKTYYIGVGDQDAFDSVEIAFNVSFEEGEVELDGTLNLPFELVLDEELSCLVPEWETVYYVYLATANGVLNFTTESANASLSIDSSNGNFAWHEGAGSVSIEVAAGDKITLCISTVNFLEDTIAFTAALETSSEEESASLAGNYTATNMGGQSFEVVITDTTITFTPPRSPEVVLEYVYENGVVTLSVGGNVITNPMGGSLTVENGVVVGMTYNGYSYTLTVAGESEEEGDEPTFGVGENTVTVTNAYSGTDVTFVAPAAGTFCFAPGANAMIGYDYSSYVEGDVLEITLEEGESVTLTILNTTWQAGDVVITVSEKAASGDEEEGGTVGSGTQADPYVINELPLTISVTGSHDLYYVWTADADCTITITYAAGNFVSTSAPYDKDATNRIYTLTVSAGDEVSINPWGSSAGEYVITLVEA